MKEQILKIADDLRADNISEQMARLLLIDLFDRPEVPSWLKDDDVLIAKTYHSNGKKLLAVKHIADIARLHNNKPLRWAKMFCERNF